MTAIVQKGDPVLGTPAAAVSNDMFGTPALATMIKDMADALEGQADGVAIAAPQIGLPYRIFLARYDRMLPPPRDGEKEHLADLGVFINPEFVRRSRRKETMEEGCLSVRGIYGKTLRHERATVRAQKENGTKFERGGGGIIAQAFQHEIDHLDGILFTDHATDLIQMNPEDRVTRPDSYGA